MFEVCPWLLPASLGCPKLIIMVLLHLIYNMEQALIIMLLVVDTLLQVVSV